MKKRLAVLVALAAVLLGSCAKIFDTMIEVVYKDKLSNFQSINVDVHLRIGDYDFTNRFSKATSLHLALVPFSEMTNGQSPQWSMKIEQQVSWTAFQKVQLGGMWSYQYDTSFAVAKGYSYRLIVWQPLGSQDISDTDPSSFIPFYFNTAYGSSEVLDEGNINSEPYGDGFFSYDARIPADMIQTFHGSSGEVSYDFSANPAPSIDTASLSSIHYFSLNRYAINRAPVTKIEVARQVFEGGGVNNVRGSSALSEWENVGVNNPYDSYYEFGLGFDSLVRVGDSSQLTIDAFTQMQLVVRMWFDNGSFTERYIPLSFYNSGSARLGAGNYFQLRVEVNQPYDSAYWAKPVYLELYDDSWSYLNTTMIGTTGPSGYLSYTYPSALQAFVDGGIYHARIVVDTNDTGAEGGYVDPPTTGYYYDQYCDVEVEVFTDSWDGSSYWGTAIADSGSYWNNW